MIKHLAAIIVGMTLVTASVGAEPPVARISALASGKTLLNGKPSDFTALEKEFERLQKLKGVVWYYRENAQAEPRPEAMAIIKLVIKYKLPISMSSRPDFSDYIDANGISRPRKPNLLLNPDARGASHFDRTSTAARRLAQR